ncbi:hypothetical protein HGH92_05325 [Chitinophaga varians]|uniref:Uncharacterized protein n=1 Tax=Chitinophaga varians TaxID=2202339 RepID=A0A847RCD3_9BACT|nr:hypothetical protein [Chitinophaga varians]NLR63720.1 hypothetical protein [Chitinophaga varians]
MDFTAEKPVITIAITVNADEVDSFTQYWEVMAEGYVKSSCTRRYFDGLYWDNDHPLLWEYTMESGSLYFNGRVTDMPALFMELWVAHQQETERWLSFDQYLEEDRLSALTHGAGLLAQGPVRLLNVYAACLDRHGISWSMIEGRRRHDFMERGKILFLGSDYIIARHFDFRRLS